MKRVFISYRSSDGKKDASRLAEDLMEVFGEQAVFFDKHDLQGGTSWREQVGQALGDRPVVLVLITPDYFGAVEDGLPRIQREDDPVRQELLAAFDGQATLLPLLTEGVTMPRAATLPADLARLPEAHALKLRTEDWRNDLARLVKDLRKLGLQPIGTQAVHKLGLMAGGMGLASPEGARPDYKLLIGAVVLAGVFAATGNDEPDQETVLGLAMLSAGSLWMAWRSHRRLTAQPTPGPKVWSWAGLAWCGMVSLALVSRGMGWAGGPQPADQTATAELTPAVASQVTNQAPATPLLPPPAAAADAGNLTGAWLARMANGTQLPFTLVHRGEEVSLTTTRLDVRNDPSFQALNQVLSSTQGFRLDDIRVRGGGRRQGDEIELAMQMTDGNGQRLLDQGSMTLVVADGGRTLAGSVHFASGMPTPIRFERQ